MKSVYFGHKVKYLHCTHIALLVCLFSFFTTSCSAISSDLQKKYGDDSSYFYGLISLNNNDVDEAERLLKQSCKKGSPLISRRSAEKLATLGNVQERIKKYLELYKKYPDEDALLLTTAELFNDEEYSKIIQLTNLIDVSTCNNQIVFYRMSSLLEKDTARFEKEFYTWCTERNITDEHYKVYCKTQNTNAQIKFRIDLYKRDYQVAYQEVRALYNENIASLSSQIISDCGKSCLYGSSNSLSDAYFFDSLINKVSNKNKFYIYFYAGRLYDKAGNYSSLSANRFLKSMEVAGSDENYDNALWYYLNEQLKISIDSAIASVEKYKDTWHNPNYFDDFFDTLSVRLLSQHKWTDFYEVAKMCDGYASDEVTAKFSYVSARLIQTGFLKLQNKSKEAEAKSLFTRALSSGTDLYYRIVAAEKLDLIGEEILKILYCPNASLNFYRNTAAENLLQGYADFGLAEYIYPEWKIFSDVIGTDCVEKIAGFLQDCGNNTNDYYTKSLRIASKKINASEFAPSEKIMQLVFPQNFHETVQTTCTRFELPEYLLYALIRSESFFNPKVVSHAGAVGLTQLMASTAGDIAHKLKVADYDLNDSDTNILFGGYYLEEMRRRLDGSSILALFAYNGGITRVRSWVKSANLEFGTNALPKDLFLEALPFSETREYGRKVVSAAALYGTLYYSKSTSEVVEEILQ